MTSEPVATSPAEFSKESNHVIKKSAFGGFKQLNPMLHTMLSLQHVETHRTVASQGGLWTASRSQS